MTPSKPLTPTELDELRENVEMFGRDDWATVEHIRRLLATFDEDVVASRNAAHPFRGRRNRVARRSLLIRVYISTTATCGAIVDLCDA